MPDSSSAAPAPFRRAIRPLLAIAWAGLIFLASSRPNLRVADDDLLDFVLRKSAHMFVFGVLAVLIARALRGEGLRLAASLAIAWILTLAYACSDEYHQTFVTGRLGHPSDVAIDMIGATLALLILAFRWRAAAARGRISP
jgi:VanZ family protein